MGFRTIWNDVTAGTAVNPATSTIPQVIKTFNLDVTDDELIAVIATFTITNSATPTAQSINLQIIVGPNTYSVPFAQKAIVNPTSIITIMFPCVSRAGDTVNVQLGGGAGAGDASTSVNVVGFYIQAWSGGKGGT